MSSATRFASITESVASAVSERTITELKACGVVNGQICTSDGVLPTTLVEGNGEIGVGDEAIFGCYKGDLASYQLKLKIPKPIELGNGLTVRYRLKGWENIRYLAIGYTSKDGFRHVKIPNPSIGEWVTFSIGYNDLAYLIKHDWKQPESERIDDIRLYLSGKPSKDGAMMDMAWAGVWLEEAAPNIVSEAFNVRNEQLLEALKKYFKRCNRDIKAQVEDFLTTGDCPISGSTKLRWPIDRAVPESFFDSGTYRYLWHAMQPAISLMVYADDQQLLAPLFAARDYVADWLSRSFFEPDADLKYTWYDHGTAERLLAFLLMHEVGLRYGFDWRFMSRLRFAITKHAQLLESEAFYASHQPTRYHNHAWFQDMALIATAAAFPALPASQRWLQRAVERLGDQLNKLIVRDNGFAVFVENSIGYHHGIQRLVEFAGELTELAGVATEIQEISRELNDWSEFFRYPDGRCPSQGDTFRRPNGVDASDGFKSGEAYPEPSCTILPKAGYAVIKGNHGDVPFMVCMFGTSLCSTHKHEDNLSVTLFFDGVEWLIDPSMYSHDYSDPIPSYLRSALAHSAPVILGHDYSIEPGCCSIAGGHDSNGFQIGGSHSSYHSIRVERTLSGPFDRLCVTGSDMVRREQRTEDGLNGYLVFHLGEGVVANVTEEGVFLQHPASRFRLHIACHQPANLRHGWQGTAADSSISGAGFMERRETTSVLYEVEEAKDVRWQLSVAEDVESTRSRGERQGNLYPAQPPVSEGQGDRFFGPSNGRPVVRRPVRCKPSLTLHVGLPKTGSTALQHVLFNMKSLLADEGVFYPDLVASSADPKHQFLVDCLRHSDFSMLDFLFNETAEATKIVLSTESLSNEFYLFHPSAIREFKATLDKYVDSVSIYVVDRDVDAWAKSYYKQAIINQESARFDFYGTSLRYNDFVRLPYVNRLLNREQLFDDLAAAFDAAVTVLSYDVCSMLEIAQTCTGSRSNAFKGKKQNESLSDAAAEVMRQINGKISTRAEKYAWSKIINSATGGGNGVLKTLAKRHEAEAFYRLNPSLLDEIVIAPNDGLIFTEYEIKTLLDTMREQFTHIEGRIHS